MHLDAAGCQVRDIIHHTSRRRHNLGDPLLKEASSTCFGGPLIFVVMVIGSETEQLRFRGNFSEVAASVRSGRSALYIILGKSTFERRRSFFVDAPSLFHKKSSVPTPPPSHGGLMMIFKNIEKLNNASTRDRVLKNIILRAASVRELFRALASTKCNISLF